MNNETTWKPVPGYEGLYEVSDDGQVRSVDRTDSRGNRLKGKTLRPSMRRGYESVLLYKGGKATRLYIHRLVLLAFVGPAPEGTEACHWNDDALDNRLENLRWGTSSDNTLDKVRNGRHPMANRTHCPRGHSLSIPENLVPSKIKAGKRNCLACSRAHGYNHKRKLGMAADSPEFQDLADEYYAELLRSLEEPELLTSER